MKSVVNSVSDLDMRVLKRNGQLEIIAFDKIINQMSW
jgi:hypothetical protein